MEKFSGCPGSKMKFFEDKSSDEKTDEKGGETKVTSHLKQWPIQLHLVSPQAPYYTGSDVLLTADCVAFSIRNFHERFLKGKSIAIACPKLDEHQEIYLEKIKSLIEDAKINTLNVMIMEVPCCNGLLALAKEAQEKASRKVPIKAVVVSIQGNVLSEEWV